MAKKISPQQRKIKTSSSSQGSPKQQELQHLERIFELMEKHEVSEFEWEKNGERIKLKTKHAISEGFQQSLSGSAFAALSGYRLSHEAAHSEKVPHSVPASVEPTTASKPTAPANNQKQIPSPFVGTFYRAATPESDPYVREGQTIKRGDVLCIIEAMKLMNEIEAEIPGKIVSVLIENGQPVEFGEPLFIIEP